MTRQSIPTHQPPVEPMLVWKPSRGRAVEFDLEFGRRITIGRDADSTIPLDSSFVSKAHAVVYQEDGQYVIEDLKSANGTRVNGQPVAVSVITPGDVIEIGDQALTFVDRTAARRTAATGPPKAVRLVLVAVVTVLVVTAALALLVTTGAPADPRPAPDAFAADAAGVSSRSASAPPVGSASASADVPAEARPEGGLVRQTVARAERAGLPPAAALFDEGLVASRAGRLREAVELLVGAVRRDPDNQVARNRLAEARAALEQAVEDHLAMGDRAFDQLRFNDAALAWERVLLLVDSSDPRHATATANLERLKARLRDASSLFPDAAAPPAERTQYKETPRA